MAKPSNENNAFEQGCRFSFSFDDAEHKTRSRRSTPTRHNLNVHRSKCNMRQTCTSGMRDLSFRSTAHLFMGHTLIFFEFSKGTLSKTPLSGFLTNGTWKLIGIYRPRGTHKIPENDFFAHKKSRDMESQNYQFCFIWKLSLKHF